MKLCPPILPFLVCLVFALLEMSVVVLLLSNPQAHARTHNNNKCICKKKTCSSAKSRTTKQRLQTNYWPPTLKSQSSSITLCCYSARDQFHISNCLLFLSNVIVQKLDPNARQNRFHSCHYHTLFPELAPKSHHVHPKGGNENGPWRPSNPVE
jgi:hypothetical protein